MSYAVDRFVKGTSVHLSGELTVEDVEADAGSVILRVRDPEGTVTTPVVNHDGTGKYHADVEVDASGKWWYRWESLAPVAAAEDTFIVHPSHVI